MRSFPSPVTLGLVVLLLLSTAIPAVGLGSDEIGTEAVSAADNSDGRSQILNRSGSSRSAKRDAIELVRGITAEWWFERRRERAVGVLKGTLPAYRDEVRVSRSVFADDRRAVGLIAALSWVNRTAADRATALVVTADLVTANTSIEDATRAVVLVRDRIGQQKSLERARSHIHSATRSRDRALSLIGRRNAGPWHSVNQRRAIRHLGVAWKHAQVAIDLLDEASDPLVTIQSRSDPPGNGSGLGARTIQGTVSDVRAYDLRQVTVEIDGTDEESVPLNVTTAPGRNATFQITRQLEGPTATVVVTATDVESRGSTISRRGRHANRNHWKGRTPPARFWADRFTWWSKDEPRQRDSAVVRFDGDGLPDVYEESAVGTDPLDVDSDSPTTESDESGNGLPDGGEDFDDDGLITYAEFTRGTDPLDNDSDGDGLPDKIETDRPFTLDPTDPDSGGDGTLDGRDDLDGDGLSARAELANGTEFTRSDSDRDGLDDGDEVTRHLTDPTKADSDGDGLGDAEELRLGVDPLTVDTDGDGEPDGRETFTTTAVDLETGVSVSLKGRGDLARSVDIEPVGQPSREPFLASPVIRLRNNTAFERATVELPVSADFSGSPDNLSVFTWDARAGDPWHPIPSTVDTQRGIAAANVTSFSYFAVMDRDRWQSAISGSVSLGWPRFEHFEDLSGWDVQGTAAVTDGRLVVSGRPGSAPEPDLVVDAAGGADFERIQPAVDAAAPGDTVLVKPGTYPESVRIETSIRLIGENATLDGTSIDGIPTAGLWLERSPSVEVRGFTISGFDLGVIDESDGADVDLADVSIQEARVGVHAWAALGDWTLTNIDIEDCIGGGVVADAAQGNWSLTDVVLFQNAVGIDARETTGDWTLETVNASASEIFGVLATNTEGDWTIEGSEISANNEHGIVTEGTHGDWSITTSRVAANGESGIVFEAGDGQLTITRSQVFGNGAGGVVASGGDPPVDAIYNWWGQPTGPTAGQVSEGIRTSPFCATQDCASADHAGTVPVRDEQLRTRQEGRQFEEPGRAPRLGSRVRRALAIPAEIGAATLTARATGATSDGSVGEIRVIGEAESEQVMAVDASATADTASVDVTRFAGQTVAVEVSATGDARVEVDWLDLSIDTDGDGLRDAVEEANLGMPTGPRPGASLAALDPDNPDTDGDGLSDGDELTEVIFRPDQLRNLGVSFQAAEATADPTRENSDGGGLNDGKEREVGSDPFVLETLVAGYTLPTMTHGPADTFEDREPMTVGQSNGILTGSGRDSSIIVWSSRQFFDPLFCIKELTPGPGCAPDWMIGVDQQEGEHYVYIPFVVYAGSNTAVETLPYEMIFSPSSGVQLVKEVNSSGYIKPSSSQRGYVVFEIPDIRVAEEGQPGVFRGIGHIQMKTDLNKSIFTRSKSAVTNQNYAVPTSTLMPATEQLLDDTQFVLEQGINVALAADSGITVAVQTGSKIKGSIVFLFELARSQVDSAPVTLEDKAQETSLRGIGSFKKQINTTEGEIFQRIYKSGVVRPVGPVLMREN